MDAVAQADKMANFIRANADLIGWGLVGVGGIIFFYNIRDIISNWFYGLGVKYSKSWEELDVVRVKGDRCFIRKFGMIKIFCLPIEKDNKTLGEGEITISYVDFMKGGTRRYGRLI